MGVTFSEFVLAVCGQKSVFGFWNATQTCRVRASRDTLTIEQIEIFASARPGIYEPDVWTFEKLYFVNGAVQRRRVANQNLTWRYDANTVRQVLRAYETTEAGSAATERSLYLAEQLFLATLTGDAKARAYFVGFRQKFPIPNGELSEQYTALREKLAF